MLVVRKLNPVSVVLTPSCRSEVPNQIIEGVSVFVFSVERLTPQLENLPVEKDGFLFSISDYVSGSVKFTTAIAERIPVIFYCPGEGFWIDFC